jgi:hypothetical protein
MGLSVSWACIASFSLDTVRLGLEHRGSTLQWVLQAFEHCWTTVQSPSLKIFVDEKILQKERSDLCRLAGRNRTCNRHHNMNKILMRHWAPRLQFHHLFSSTTLIFFFSQEAGELRVISYKERKGQCTTESSQQNPTQAANPTHPKLTG